jgi:hypothetical protein
MAFAISGEKIRTNGIVVKSLPILLRMFHQKDTTSRFQVDPVAFDLRYCALFHVDIVSEVSFAGESSENRIQSE